MAAADIVVPTPVPLTIEDLTRGVPEGNGVFDEIMKTIETRIVQEYDKNRIKGSDYSKVYLGTMEAALQQSIIFLLGKDKAANEAALIAAQALKVEAEIEKIAAEIILVQGQAGKVAAETALIGAQQLKVEAEIDLIAEQKEKIKTEILVLLQDIEESKQKVLQSKAQVSLILAQELKTDAETSLVGEQEDKVEEETKLLKYRFDNIIEFEAAKAEFDAQLAGILPYTEQGKTNDTIYRQDGSYFTIGGVMGSQKEKLDAEKALVSQKKETEYAQTRERLPDGSNVEGYIGKQKDVYDAQIEGFTWDAQKNLAKVFSDTWSVAVSNDIQAPAEDYGISAGSVKSVMDKARSGLDIT